MQPIVRGNGTSPLFTHPKFNFPSGSAGYEIKTLVGAEEIQSAREKNDRKRKEGHVERGTLNNMTKCVAGQLINEAQTFEIRAALWDKFDSRAAAD